MTFVSASVIDVTGTFTVTTQLAKCAPLSLVAVIVAVPVERAIILPLGSTLTMSGLLDVHDTPFRVALPGFGVAERTLAVPMSKESVCLLIVIDVTGTESALTVTEHSAFIVPFEFVTVIFAVPACTPVTAPFALTEAMEVLDELHFSAVLPALLGVTDGSSRTVPPTATLAAARMVMPVG